MQDITQLVEKIRYSSREMVRELGMLSNDSHDSLPPSFCHTLIELERHGSLSQIELSILLRLNKSTISRIIKKLLLKKLITATPSPTDQRCQQIKLTASGKKMLAHIHALANQQVSDSLLQLSTADQKQVQQGIALYAKALKQARIHNEYQICPIQKKDNLELMMLIKKVLQEHGANRSGFAFVDPELEDMYTAFNQHNSFYFIVKRKSDNKIMGGAGIGPLQGGQTTTCELKKMYFLPEIRGVGFGNILLQDLLVTAKQKGYKQCYLETLLSMDKANSLYQKSGFKLLAKPLGNTGHYGCNAWYLKKL
jgi:putative acetyltransferase